MNAKIIERQNEGNGIYPFAVKIDSEILCKTKDQAKILFDLLWGLEGIFEKARKN